MWDLTLILCYCSFSCEIHFLELLEQELIQGSFSHSTELTLLLCSYSVKKVVAAFCDFLALFPSYFYLNLFSLSLCYPYLAEFLSPLSIISPQCGILSWKRSLKGQFHEFIGSVSHSWGPLYPPSVEGAKPFQCVTVLRVAHLTFPWPAVAYFGVIWF